MTASPDVGRGRQRDTALARLRRDVGRAPTWVWDVALTVLVLLLAVSAGTAAPSDWDFYREGRELLLRADGLTLYAQHPIYQIGPLSLGVSGVLSPLPGDPVAWGRAATALLLLPVLVLCRTLVADILTPPRAPWLGWMAIALAWYPLAAVAQLGDALALLGVLAALVLLRRDLPVAAGVALALGVAAKPWALVLLPLLLFTTTRARWRAVGAAAVVGLLTWAPFVLADLGTLRAGRQTILVAPDAWQHALGLGDFPPEQWRAFQLLVCWAIQIAVWLLARRRGGLEVAVLVAAAAAVLARLVTDLSTWPYYVSVALPLIWMADVATSRGRTPWPTLLAFVPVLSLGTWLGDSLAPPVRVGLFLASAVVLSRRWWRGRTLP